MYRFDTDRFCLVVADAVIGSGKSCFHHSSETEYLHLAEGLRNIDISFFTMHGTSLFEMLIRQIQIGVKLKYLSAGEIKGSSRSLIHTARADFLAGETVILQVTETDGYPITGEDGLPWEVFKVSIAVIRILGAKQYRLKSGQGKC